MNTTLQDVLDRGGFWQQTSAVNVFVFIALIAAAIGLFVFVKWWLDRRQQVREAEEFLRYSRGAGFTAEEYELAVDLVNHHKVAPAMRLLVSLRQFDAIASREILEVLRDQTLEPAHVRRHIECFYSMRAKLAARARSDGGLTLAP